MNLRGLLVVLMLLVGPSALAAGPAAKAVTDWAAIVQQAIHNAAAPRSAGTSLILQAMVQLAMYDAAVAVKGRYEPYAISIPRQRHADVRAAVATAAYRTARVRVLPSQLAYLDEQYASYLAAIPGGLAKSAGIQVGETAAAALLVLRANDGFANVVLYQCSAVPPPVGEFEPDTGCPAGPTSAQPVDVKLGQIAPFTMRRASQFRPDGPDPLTSVAYAEDFEETRDYGRADSVLRTPEQTDVAYFWSENPYVFWNRNLIALANARELNVLEAARFLAMVQTAAADTAIAGFEAKYHYGTWRPRTAIPQADYDGNPDTDGDPTWMPLLRVNHPYPSGHAFWSTAVTDTIAAFFGTHKVPITLVVARANVPQVVQAERTYRNVNVLMREVVNARVWGGLHWRHSMRHGAQSDARSRLS